MIGGCSGLLTGIKCQRETPQAQRSAEKASRTSRGRRVPYVPINVNIVLTLKRCR
ncbi:hypothetical protein RCO48_12895 [Peribacillus frigoritolerans]|nr:hypothetical protein [Peribacillus frigoritolerans]